DLPILSDAPVACWPEWLQARHRPHAQALNNRIRVPDDVSLRRLVRLVAGALPGERNCLTFWAGCRAGEMVASRLLSVDSAVAIIIEAAIRAGLPYSEASRTTWSGIRASRGCAHA